MCGRYTLTVNLSKLRDRFGFEEEIGFEYVPRYNIAPTQNVAVIVNKGGNHMELFRWGLIPYWAKDPEIGNRLINARAETLAEKPSFKRSFRQRRCLVLADSFYEWRKIDGYKIPMRIILKSREPFGFAGLWDCWHSPEGEDINSFTIITTTPNELLKSIHNRMPVVLSPEEEKTWLNPNIQDEFILSKLLDPYPSEEMEVCKVSRLVNSPSNDIPECIRPVE